ncbi:MAG: alanine racemase [Actinomycetota bacterium]
MSFNLQVDVPSWRAHLDEVAAGVDSLVPVIKGNGYGFGCTRLASEASRLTTTGSVGAIAVGEAYEVPVVAQGFPGDIMVLAPYRAGFAARWGNQQVIWTVSGPESLAALHAEAPGARIIVELRTSMIRHGFTVAEAASAVSAGGFDPSGISVHLPLRGDRVAQVFALVAEARSAGLPMSSLWVSHLSPTQVNTVQERLGFLIHSRVGTKLWLGAPSALTVSATILDVHGVSRGQHFGYLQRRARRGGSLVVVSGGTAHGVGLSAPRGASAFGIVGLRARAGEIVRMTGREPSPFVIGGRRRWFAEPPHMQCSMVWVPDRDETPVLGGSATCRVRFTTATFDTVQMNSDPATSRATISD